MNESPYRWIKQAQEHHVWSYPIKATIRPWEGRSEGDYEVIVWPDWIEKVEEVNPYEPDYELEYDGDAL